MKVIRIMKGKVVFKPEEFSVDNLLEAGLYGLRN